MESRGRMHPDLDLQVRKYYEENVRWTKIKVCDQDPPIEYMYLSGFGDVDFTRSDCSSISSESTNEDVDTLDLECIQLNDKEEIETSVSDDNYDQELRLESFYNSQYSDDIWSHLKYIESVYEWPYPRYMEKQREIKAEMRTMLVDWLIKIQDKYNIDEATLHLAVIYLDKYLTKVRVKAEKFRLIGAVVMLMAGKIEGLPRPNAKDWLYICNNEHYTLGRLKRTEQQILRWLNFDLQPPTILAFIRHLCTDHKQHDIVECLAMYFSEFALLEGGNDYLQHPPSKVAAASIALARFTMYMKNPWPRKFGSSSGYSLKQLYPVMQMQNKSFADSPNKQYQASELKYADPYYHELQSILPRPLSVIFPEE